MKIHSIQKSSLSDYPGCIAAIVFTPGCNFRCPYCHNGRLVNGNDGEIIALDKVLSFLEKRKGRLQGMVISGGEPTLQKGLVSFCQETKRLGYKIKIDTNGSRPDVLSDLMENKLVDYIAMDIKAPLQQYPEITNTQIDTQYIEESITQIINNNHIDHEFRTTVVRSQLSQIDLIQIAQTIKGAKHYFLQKFIPANTLNPSFITNKTYSDDEFLTIIQQIKHYIPNCRLR